MVWLALSPPTTHIRYERGRKTTSRSIDKERWRKLRRRKFWCERENRTLEGKTTKKEAHKNCITYVTNLWIESLVIWYNEQVELSIHNIEYVTLSMLQSCSRSLSPDCLMRWGMGRDFKVIWWAMCFDYIRREELKLHTEHWQQCRRILSGFLHTQGGSLLSLSLSAIAMSWNSNTPSSSRCTRSQEGKECYSIIDYVPLNSFAINIDAMAFRSLCKVQQSR